MIRICSDIVSAPLATNLPAALGDERLPFAIHADVRQQLHKLLRHATHDAGEPDSRQLSPRWLLQSPQLPLRLATTTPPADADDPPPLADAPDDVPDDVPDDAPPARCVASPDPSMARFATQMPNESTKRPPGDNRTAQQIIDDNPLLKHLGNQSGIRDKLNQFVGGDMYNNPDQAYKAAALLTYVKSSKNREGGERPDSVVGDGKIDGFTKDGDARHGTEAGLLQDVVGSGGWQHLRATGHQLDQTSDTHVRLDGTNKDNLQWGFEQAGKYIGAVFKGIGKAVVDIVTKGRFNPVSAVLSVVKNVGTSVAKQAVEDSNLSPDAKQTANKVFGALDFF
ncbi:hypothetical protein BTM_5416 [Burkholderia thailandensis 34]|uniref:hypothetical protein n=1 Tax=Burkholderia thailandensis TaxID=57975 RepID=UPI0005D831E0|nr:hypothetical protein [Burkholderia thailandensis]AJY31595.1 hypothetical protein BTM_5416 [Burkholderia thailandensis 34]AOJ59921.1 hypothetical protein AQ477_25820 [Burkholderia thailandensis]KXF59291.1 hypothetical protein AQ476_18760 [Burkholderia thailandensis]MCZ2897217.1 hypothetical protein [Burkholderia thailandensis]PNE78375.1 hypothetical protein A8H37_09390 [Burkholderia thailandensis]